MAAGPPRADGAHAPRKPIKLHCRYCGVEHRYHARPCTPGMISARLLPAIDADAERPRRGRKADDAPAG